MLGIEIYSDPMGLYRADRATQLSILGMRYADRKPQRAERQLRDTAPAPEDAAARLARFRVG